jgi:uncharacterized membrane protein
VAANELKGWEKANDDIKRGAIGVLAKDKEGKIKAHKLGTRETARGAGVGAVLGIIATVLSGGLALLAGVVGGIIVGGLLGSFVHRGLGMSEEDLRLLGERLDAGGAAVAVLVPADEVDATTAEFKKIGGDIATYQISEEALQQASEAVKSIEA